MSDFVFEPKVQRLIDDLTQNLKNLTREVLLGGISEMLGEAPKRRLALPAPRQRRVIFPLASKPTRRPRLTLKPKSVPALPQGVESEYMPAVSNGVKGQVSTGLVAASKPITSKELAERLILGETTVRCALKHLVKEGVASVQTNGRKVLYATV